MEKIDIHFDYRQDSKCGDPDADSQLLYNTHILLWGKALPNGKKFELAVNSESRRRLLIKNNLCMNLSSDRMCPHFDGKYTGKFDGRISDKEMKELKQKIRTIGGHIVFPAHKKNGFTINQARGLSRRIGDRFDLTLECIRRFYRNEKSPLEETLNNYKDFFDLFIDFNGYIEFFLLQDFLDEHGGINFSIPFKDFNVPAFPKNLDEYRFYIAHTIDLVNLRNQRIQKCY